MVHVGVHATEHHAKAPRQYRKYAVECAAAQAPATTNEAFTERYKPKALSKFTLQNSPQHQVD
eukprot:6370916-Pyramimonas_sp.AAC.1